MGVLERNNVSVHGTGPCTIMFAHGFGCDKAMWRYVSPAFEDHYTTVLFDNVGAGGSDMSAYSYEKYGSLEGYADDIVEIGRELAMKDAVFVGHSVSAMIGILAAKKAREMFKALVLVGPSPRYINDDGYVGGFTLPQMEELLDFLDTNHLGWSAAMAPVIMGNPDRAELGEELTNSFCRTDPAIARHFAHTTFLSDTRPDIVGIDIPVLVLQCSDDVIAPEAVGEYVHRSIPNSKLVVMEATGHCPNLSAPDETIANIKEFLDELSAGG
ncbi:alpha/beta fold hydrolase [Phyllobacterium endophyticum]|uniref:alpha/beta fold hydrolase n=1 Tax=Phyllobacterium endophyticum TaxID=1149773 RepID=UPI0011CB3DD5|nr:alpha/beta hydrolase [Phyllobacterium endophyticum]TXR46366.1 alpha/beta hydrolase [Phyllobacterium endophyticum]